MKHLKLELGKAQEAYKKGTKENQQFLITMYGEEHFLTNIKDRLKGYESACKILGQKELTVDHFAFLGEKQAKKEFSRHRIITGIKAINEGWYPDTDNSNQNKYYVYMQGKKSGFSSGVFCCGYGSVVVCSDFYIETREKAEIIERIFREDYIISLF